MPDEPVSGAPTPPRIPDAIKTPAGWAKGDNGDARTIYHRKVLGPIFGLAPDEGRVWVHNEATHNFCHATKSKSRFVPVVYTHFPSTHPRAGEERYEWVLQPDGTSHGFLIPEEPDAS